MASKRAAAVLAPVRRFGLRCFAWACLLGGLLLAAQPAPPAPRAPGHGPVVGWVVLDATLNPGSADFLVRAIETAPAAGLDLLVIQLDTPGGLVVSTRHIVEALLSAPVPVVVWVAPDGARAGSAGVFVTLGAHVAAMAPATNIGAAHPLAMGPGREGPPREQAEKLTNDTAAWARAIASARGRNADWAERAVRESDSITAQRALELGVIDLVAPTREALLAALDGRAVTVNGRAAVLATTGAEVRALAPALSERLLIWLGDPNIAFMLLGLGVLALLVEAYVPGFGVPGVVGLVSIALALVATRLVPLSTGAIVLILVGAGLLVAELFVTSFGLLTVAGLACLVLGALFLVNPADPDFLVERRFGVAWSLVLPAMAVAAVLAGLVAYKVLQARRAPPLTGALGLVGEAGVAVGEVGDEHGQVFVHGELWEARSPAPIHPGAHVRVDRVEGLVVRVHGVEHPP